MFLSVTAYYNIPSKAHHSIYLEYIKKLFNYVKTPLLFFTDKQNYDILSSFAGNNVKFYIQEFSDMRIFKYVSIDTWKKNITIDPENFRHSWQLGAIWANKSLFVQQAKELLETYEWYMWIDAGCIRSDDWKHIIHDFGKRNFNLIPGVYLQLLNEIPDKYFFTFPDRSIAASHILFHRNFIDDFIKEYNNVLVDYENSNITIIKDQYIIASMVKKGVSFLITIDYNPQIHCVPESWFFFFLLF